MAKAHTPTDFKYHLADMIRRERLQHGFNTIEELSEASGVGTDQLMLLEIGKIPDRKVIFRLARFYKKRVRISFV